METVLTLSPRGVPVNAHFWCSEKNEPPRGVPFPLGVSKMALLSPDIIMGG